MTRTIISANLLFLGALWGQSAATVSIEDQTNPSPEVAPQSTPSAVRSSKTPAGHRYQPNRFTRRASAYYGLVWGVDSLSVKTVESGEIIRFSYRVVDPDKAKVLIDKKAEPALISPEKGIKLVIPSLEQVGLLRQTPTGAPEAGKAYWMAFSNSRRLLKRGDRVDVVIGNFQAVGLTLE